MQSINKLRKFYELKHVERVGPVGERKESPAEHSWSSIILADYFLSITEEKLDRLKVYELLLYHDVVEIETGDVCISKIKERLDKKEKEMAAAHILRDHMPSVLGEKFLNLFKEFEKQETREARFSRAIDSFDSLIHFLDYKEYWKGWTEEKVRKFHGKNIKHFPEIEQSFEALLKYVRAEGYFDQ